MDRQIDDTDAALLTALAEDARAPIAALARRLGVARTTVQARIERLEAKGVIAGYTLKPGARLKPALRATVLVAIEPRSGPAVLARLKALPGVEAAHTTSGRVDMILEVTADTTEALDITLDRIGEAKGVRSSESLIHLSTKLDRR
ncbi:Lrp/AsnC family transcriptional regulator [Roseivivax sediminis]|uniref:DNA-binding transcriptional regulator, Lrp family n=1 Tax=Roseivivax sediminis TaxID=936889 RepID=A0A1I2BNC8_9RHOB|nr:Lrp/AsnC family transcriptional regulator [Roseivivax sediminis]SFE57674.1 DNA-binding transcriptional regulator, Lrp family [Roseivivax sediminis]